MINKLSHEDKYLINRLIFILFMQEQNNCKSSERAPHLESPKRFPVTISTSVFLLPAPVSIWTPPLHLQPMAVTVQLFLARRPLNVLVLSHHSRTWRISTCHPYLQAMHTAAKIGYHQPFQPKSAITSPNIHYMPEIDWLRCAKRPPLSLSGWLMPLHEFRRF